MKLSKAQAEVMAEAKAVIDTARKYKTYDEYLANEEWFVVNRGWTVEKYKNTHPYGERFWKNKVNGIAMVRCNTRTLKKLEEFGLIEIIYDSTGEAVGIDEIKVLNY